VYAAKNNGINAATAAADCIATVYPVSQYVSPLKNPPL